MLCFLCRKIQIKSTESSWSLQHHLTFGDLTESADGGCELCMLFRATLLHYYAESLGGSASTAENLHRELDNDDIGQAETDRRVFYVELGSMDVDERFAPCETGAYGLIFIRKIPGDYSSIVEEVVPFMEFSAQPDSNAVLGGWIVGREVARTPDFSLGKKWMDECREKHRECGHLLQSRLPLRVIDVGFPDGSQMPRLVLRGGFPGDYAALSHCWGSSKPMITDSTTFRANVEGIPYANLPKTFQHAVRATRELGLRYLWIDSLCIIQDSQEDWEQHCSEMPDIYRNAMVTIAGPAAADCNTGFLLERPRPLSVNLTISNGDFDQEVTLSHSGVRSCDYPETEKNSPLAKRACVLQERLLSRRILYFGSDFMYFECWTNVRREYLHYPFIDNYQVRSEVTKRSFFLEQDCRFWLQYWCQIVSTYSELALTFTSDRLPALSGIVREIQRKLGDRYIAGLWLTDLPRGLTWFNPYYRLHKELAQGYNDCALPYVAPSWSWASSRGRMSFCDLNYRDHVFISEDIQIIGVDIKVRGSNTFGEVQEGVLTLRGRLQVFTIRSAQDLVVPGRQSLFVCSNKSPSQLGLYHPDKIPESQLRKSTEMALQPLSFEQSITFLYLGYFKDSKSYLQWAALAIELITGTEDQYRRVGLGYGRQDEFPQIEDFWQESETKVLKIL